MNQQLPPIVQLAKRLLVEIEQAVRKFTRDFRYGLGADLRRLVAGFHRRFRWLAAAARPRKFSHRLEDQPITVRFAQ